MLITNFTIVKPGGGDIHAGDELRLTTSFTNGTGPFTLGYLLDANSVDPTTIPVMPRTTNASPDQFNVTVLAAAAPGVYRVDVGIADSLGNVDSESASFTVVASGGNPDPTNSAPTISVAGDDATCTVTVTVSDADGDDITIDQAVPAALSALDGSQTVSAAAVAWFSTMLQPTSWPAASGTINFTVNDGTAARPRSALTCSARVFGSPPTRCTHSRRGNCQRRGTNDDHGWPPATRPSFSNT